MQTEGGEVSEAQVSEEIAVLFVDDDPAYAGLVRRLLERQATRLTVTTVSSAIAALDHLADTETTVDAIVSDYAMPGMDGLELLDIVRTDDTSLPFILLTGNGSEDTASTAIARGADDYIQKGTATGLAEVLTNRITNAVERARSQAALARREERFQTLITNSPAIISVLAPDGTFQYVSPSVTDILGYAPEHLLGTDAFAKIHPADREAVWDEFAVVLESPDEVRRAEYRYKAASGEWQWLEAHGNNRLTDPVVEGIVINVQDITARKERERDLERQNERLEEFTSVVSHDLRNPLAVAHGWLAIVREERDSEALARIEHAHDRMEHLIDNLLTLAKRGETVGDPRPVDLRAAVERAWTATATQAATLAVADDLGTIAADPERLDELLGNLFRNAVEHGGATVTVRVEHLSDGFAVADDGPGIPASKRDQVFDHGYTTSDGGIGFGLSIVHSIVAAHGWEIGVTASEAGGTRFDITGVDPG